MMYNSVIKLYVGNENAVYQPEFIERITLEYSRKNAPGKLVFTVQTDGGMPLSEGDEVMFVCDGSDVFYGYVFSVSRNNSGTVSAVAYDSLRYFKNKDSYAYQSITAGELVKMISLDYGLKTGEICDTGYRIPSRIECSATLFDIIENALDITKCNTGREFVLFDKLGKINLCEPEKLRVDIMIDERSAELFEFNSTIDSGVYNKIKITRSRENCTVFDTAEDRENIAKWGVLQYFSGADKTAEAASLLELYNQPSTTLFIKNACGDINVRGGSAVAVNVDFGNEKLKKYVLVEHVKHEFKNGLHLMSLDCRPKIL